MINISPITRITLGLVLIMMSIFMLSDMFGFIPNRDAAIKKGRSDLAENLAVQFSIDAQKRNTSAIKSSMRTLVHRNDDVLSAALRETSGALLAIAGDHGKHWTTTDDVSTPENITVPIYKGIRRWGTVEVSFVPLHTAGLFGFYINPLVKMAVFVLVAGFVGFLFFIKKTHEHIDPTEFVPSRVSDALNSLAEGVLLLDSKEHIVLANTAFAKTMQLNQKKLIGKKASSLKWEFTTTDEVEYPWITAVTSGETQTGNQLHFSGKSGEKHTFVVNSSPIQDGDGENRGVLVTFDDITQIEEKNTQLENTLGMLKKSRDEISQQKDKLQVLATRDPLTNCLNRRSFFEKYGAVFKAAKNSGEPITCMMADIDLFKSINDRFGHARGDEVIISVAQSLRKSLRSSDKVCRYGGEEFCIILPDMSLDDAIKTAERARVNIESSSTMDDPETKVTASFGIATINQHTESLTQMIDQADKALYMSKENGRNCLTVWDQEAERNESGDPASIHTAGSSEGNSGSTNDAALKPEHDSLTGLPNRSKFHTHIIDAIKHCRATGQSMAVMMLDLDMFKRINNALGYQVGDKLLTTISTRLLEVLRKTDSISRFKCDDTNTSIYRLGGDEFGILLSGMNDTEFIEQIVKRILDTVTEPLEIDGNEIHLTSSIGISHYSGTGAAVDRYSLLNNAGMALFYAKRNGHNTYQFYDEELSNDSLDSLKLENDLRHALERNELELYYQPKVELFSGKIAGMEALLRWKHSTIGMIQPDEFIPLAEETGLIIEIGEWVLNTACEKLKEWESTDNNNISIAVNLSPVQFRQSDLLGMIQGIVNSTGANPKLLELEITESTIMDDLDSASATMRELHNEGIQISIDDFGTGYSSLNHLKRFPISAVKIDRSFVRDLTKDPDDAAIVGAIIAMAHGMGLKIIAEGVETEQQLEYLHRLRCDEIQGFLFSKALPEDEIEELLKQDKGSTAFPDRLFQAVS